jgi:hypothetical protein
MKALSDKRASSFRLSPSVEEREKYARDCNKE